MGKGYAEGPAAEERFAALERGETDVVVVHPPDRQAVYGSTPDDREDVDPDRLFESGKAWGLTVVLRASPPNEG